ncbi:hypothetical protein BH11ARM2_BH11ARM2_30830 [soil metagenome]
MAKIALFCANISYTLIVNEDKSRWPKGRRRERNLMLSALALILLNPVPQISSLEAVRPVLSPLTISVDQPEVGRPVFAERFQSEDVDGPVRNVQHLASWQVTQGSVDLVSGSVPGPTGSSQESLYVNLGGSLGQPGTLQSTNPVLCLPGVKYALNLSYNSSNGATQATNVRIGSQTFHLQSGTKAFRRETFRFSFSEATQTRLVFQSLGDGHGGIGIGNVSVVPVAAPRIP